VNSTIKTVVLWVVLLLVGVVLWRIIQGGNGSTKDSEISYTSFMDHVAKGDVQEVEIENNLARGKYKNDNSKTFHVFVPANNPEMLKALQSNNVSVKFKDSQGSNWPMWLFQFSPILLLGVLWFVMIRQMQTGGNKALSFGKSRARLLSMQQKKITFKDVAGVDEPKKSCAKSSSSCARRRSSRSSADVFPKACSLWAIPEPVRRFWPGLSPARPTFPSSAFPALIS
jgi:cell division protease FtsH